MKLLCALLLVVATSSTWGYHDPHFVDNRSSMVHLFEWKWTDIAQECEDFLAPYGYGAIQVSPPMENLMVTSMGRPWWERYQPMSYKIDTRSGNEQQYADMVRRCNNVGVRIYVDAIINHMTGYWPENTGTAGSTANFAEWDYPSVPYDTTHFNWPRCTINDYFNPVEVRDCELLDLKDLNQRNEYVRDKISEYMNHLIRLGTAGFRIDAAKHMWPQDLEAIMERLDDLPTEHGFAPGSRPFIYSEVIDLGFGEAVTVDEYFGLGTVTEFKVGVELSRCFMGQNPLRWLENWGIGWGLMASDLAIAFVDNHDTQRGHGPAGEILNYKSPRAYSAALAWMLGHAYGLPQILSGFDFTNTEIGPPMDWQQNIISPSFNPDGTCGSGWICEHRWPHIARMVDFRNVVKGTEVHSFWHNFNNQAAFSRGEAGFIAFNIEVNTLSQSIYTGLPAGNYCDIASGVREGNQCTGKTVSVGVDRNATITIQGSDPQAFLAIHIGERSRLP